MTVQLSRSAESFVALADHCMGCVHCKPDLDAPHAKKQCPTAHELYRTWKSDWTHEAHVQPGPKDTENP
ncbi:hypothetical protein [Streptomyces graminilatus]|uniref:hypothetical protein n=1 Tax=Streptomyces graminilatus TaxID=1464070 RepID=UPI0006E1F11E|nr:hypothetical protein [Streptomyces graminilatus]